VAEPAGANAEPTTLVQRADRALLRLILRLSGDRLSFLTEMYDTDPGADESARDVREMLGYFWLVVSTAVAAAFVLVGENSAFFHGEAVGLVVSVAVTAPFAICAVHTIIEPILTERGADGERRRVPRDGNRTFFVTTAVLALILWLVIWVGPS
jgi:hypothetical protein